MAGGFYKDVCKELKSCGYAYLENAKGSHEKWKCGKTDKIVIVPQNLKSKHTANSILKDAGSIKKF